MFKNSKILKGMTLALAVVLLVACGIVFVIKSGSDAVANAKEVVLYVSDNGDNTTGSDEATAFTSFDAALTQVNNKKYATGTRIVLIVPDRITVSTKTVDSVVAMDASGYRLPVTITSMGATCEEDKSMIYLTYEDANAKDDTSKYSTNCAIFTNDVTLKDINVVSKVFDYGFSFDNTKAPYHQKYIHFSGYELTIDNCYFLREDTGAKLSFSPEYSGANAYRQMTKIVNLKNIDLESLTLSRFRLPYFDFIVNFENVKITDTLHTLTSSDATTDDFSRVQLNFYGGTNINKLYYARAHISIPQGYEMNFYPGSTVSIVNSTSAMGLEKHALVTDLTFNVLGGTITTLYAAPQGLLDGNTTVNFKNGSIGTLYMGGGAHNKKADDGYVRKPEIMGNTTLNMSGGKVTKAFYAASTANGIHYGVVTNNISGGTISCDAYLGGSNANTNGIVNNISGGTFNKVYYGGSGNVAATATTIVNNVTGGTFKSKFFGGCVGTVDRIANYVSGVTIANDFYGGAGKGSVTGTVESTLKNVTFKKNCYGACGTTAVLKTSVNTNLVGCTVTGDYYGGNHTSPINEANITTTAENCTFGAKFVGGMQTVDETAYANNISNTLKDCKVTGTYVGGTSTGYVIGNVANTITNTPFEGSVFCGNESTGGNVAGTITSSIENTSFGGNVSGANATEAQTFASATLSIKNAETLKLSGSLYGFNGLTTTFESQGPVLINEDTSMAINTLVGKLTVAQTQNWLQGQAYVTLATPVAAELVVPMNSSSSVTGSGVFDGSVLSGYSEETIETPVVAAPDLADLVSFHLGDKLGVRFWVPEAKVNEYVELNGVFDYEVRFGGKVLISGSVDEISELPLNKHSETLSLMEYEGENYFTFMADLEVSASQYDQKVSVVLGKINEAQFTVYQLLEKSIDTWATTESPEMASLLKAAYEYGVAAQNAFAGGRKETKYEVSYSENYTSEITAEKNFRGYTFVSTSISLNDTVSINYCFKGLYDDVTFEVYNMTTGEKLNASDFVITEVTDNENFNYIITLKLAADELGNVYEARAISEEEIAGSCTTSVANACTYYIENEAPAKLAAEALLAYMEAINVYLATR